MRLCISLLTKRLTRLQISGTKTFLYPRPLRAKGVHKTLLELLVGDGLPSVAQNSAIIGVNTSGNGIEKGFREGTKGNERTRNDLPPE